jgi:hypothetical protein
MGPPARRGHRGLRPGGKAEEEGGWEDRKMRRWAKSKTEGWGDEGIRKVECGMRKRKEWVSGVSCQKAEDR